jgi:hypothetical protein
MTPYSCPAAIPTTTTFRTLRDELHYVIRDLEEFCDHIHTFFTWSNWMRMEHNMMLKILFNTDSLRLGAVIEKWKALKMQYAAYADEVWRH